MNRIILSLLLTTAFAAPAIAQNCVNASRCDELGYTKTIADCNGLDTLVCPFDKNKVFCSSPFHDKSCEVGDTLYSDKKCYSIVPTEAIAIGVVFDAENRLAVALDETKTSWASYNGGYDVDIPTLENCDRESLSSCAPSGKNNTSVILTYGKANGIEYSAAEYCNKYKTVGTQSGDWFLPSTAELLILSANYSVVNAKLIDLGKALSTNTVYLSNYGSSSEYDKKSCWRINLKEGSGSYWDKYNSYSTYYIIVRPVLAF